MARKNINRRTTADGSDGDDVRTAFTQANEHFTKLYVGVGTAPDQPPGSLMMGLAPGTHRAYWPPEDLT